MGDQSGLTQFCVRFETALQAYQQTTSVILVEHPLTVQLQHPHTIESITAILKYEARVSSGLLGCDRILKSIESTVSILFSLSATGSFSGAIVLVRKEARRSNAHIPDEFSQPYPPAKSILAGLAILFSVRAVL